VLESHCVQTSAGQSRRCSGLRVMASLAAWALITPALAADIAAGRQADLAYARSEYVMKTQSLSNEQRRHALAYLQQTASRVASMSNAEFLIAIARIPAFADNGHDVFNSGQDAWWPDTRLPFRLVWFPDGLLVARAAPEQKELLGARITRLEGLTPERLLAKLHEVCGGTEAFRRWNALWALNNGQFLHALGIAKSADRLHFDALLRNGHSKSYTVEYVTEASVPSRMRPTRLLSGDLSTEETEKGWAAAVASDSEPLYQQQSELLFRRARLPELKALYLQLRSNLDEHGQLFGPFLKETLSDLRASPVQNLIFDLRFDVGGDISQSRNFLREITQVVPGRIYVLISPYTFSAGIVSAAALKHDAGPRVTLVGEEVGDRLRFWSEGEPNCLPNSHFCLRPTSGLWDLVHGCNTEPECYGDQFEATAGTLRPQLSAPLSAAAWLAGRDLAMEQVAKDLHGR
jgi:hypothetical protein